MHIASTDNILAELASEMDLNLSEAGDLLDHVLAADDDADTDEIDIPESRRIRC